jgi:hypothetical protein
MRILAGDHQTMESEPRTMNLAAANRDIQKIKPREAA